MCSARGRDSRSSDGRWRCCTTCRQRGSARRMGEACCTIQHMIDAIQKRNSERSPLVLFCLVSFIFWIVDANCATQAQ
jgi:hypothetical protein